MDNVLQVKDFEKGDTVVCAKDVRTQCLFFFVTVPKGKIGTVMDTFENWVQVNWQSHSVYMLPEDLEIMEKADMQVEAPELYEL